MITIGTFNVTSSASLNITTMPGNISDFATAAFAADYGPDTYNAISYLWSQLGTNAGLPDGVNGS
jgi:hypothetical protein